LIVADTNLLARLILGGPQLESARAVYDRDSDWSAPVLWRSEFTSVLSRYLRRQELSLAGAEQLYELAADLLAGREYFVPPSRVLRLLTTSPCSAYDSEFVALAQVLGTRLVTSDKQVLRSFPQVAITPDQFAAGSS